MSRILIIEDEAMLRSTMVRGISKLENIQVDDAGTFAEGIACIEAHAPSVIFSDICLPDRSGLELLGELEGRNLHIPVVYVTAFLKTFQPMIPMHEHVKVLEKPVGLNELRSIVSGYLRSQSSSSETAPFGVADYLQLAGMGHYSIVIEVQAADEQRGTIVIVSGEVWSARTEKDGQIVFGEDAFALLVFMEDSRVSCTALSGDAGERNIEASWEGLLMDAARRSDETNMANEDLSKGSESAEGNTEDLAEQLNEEFGRLLSTDQLEE